MKTLFLMRHAKSDWSDAGLTDFERPLNERGQKAAPLMGETMRKNDFSPDLIVSSPAKRAAQTAEAVKKAAKFTAEIRFERRIYEASNADLLEILGEQNDQNKSLLLVGHNPGFEDLVHFLTGTLQPMPTAALAVIDLEINGWRELNSASGSLRILIRPKEL